ncbi:MAG: hypothetical protein GY851_34355, partial [bacterium]|nr:hypothetical protein [bacterium]
FRNFNKESMRVLALMDPGEERAKQDSYNIPAYPVVWVSQVGEGRVYYSALGHREDVWENKKFQKTVVDALKWASGKGEAAAKPNFDDVVSE